jgi:PAS domain S-box-containing protein
VKPTVVVSTAIRAVQSALAGIDRTAAVDLVRRRQAEAILSVLADTPVAILLANDRARFVEANAAATTLTGYSRRELLEMAVWDLTPDANQVDGKRAWDAFLRDGEQSGTYPLRRKDGKLLHPTYFATAHVLPSLHLSALATAALIRHPKRPTMIVRPRRRRT